MTTTTNAPIQLEFALPAAPDTTQMHATVEARLETITTRALPAARERRQFLETVWASETSDAATIFFDNRAPFRCNPVGMDRVSAAAANEAALITETVALHDLQRTLERYDAGGPLVTGTDHEIGVPPQVTSDPIPANAGALTFRTFEARTAHVQAVRAYVREVERELRAAIKGGRTDTAATLRAERIGVSAHLQAVTGEVRRRVRAADRSRADDNRARRIA